MVAKFNLFSLLLIVFICLFFFTCSEVFHFETDLIPNSAEPAYRISSLSNSVEIILMGDSGSGRTIQYNVASWMKTYTLEHDIAFALMLGDNYYDSGVDSVNDPLFASRFEDVYNDNISTLQFYSVLGNHDINGNIDAQILYTDINPQWKMPYLYYNFTYTLGDNTKIEFIALDSNIIEGNTSMMADEISWFRDVLSSSDADWKIVYAHHPLYSNGSHGDNISMIIALEDIMDEYNVDLYTAGHDHDLQLLEPVRGIQHVVSGAAGKTRETSVRDNTLYGKGGIGGFMTLTISKNLLVIKVLVENAAVDYELIMIK